MAGLGNNRGLREQPPVDNVGVPNVTKDNDVPADHLTPEQACAEAIRLAGGPALVARHFKISPQAVHKWKVVPERRCLGLSRLIGYRIGVHHMRPDVFGISDAELREALKGVLEALS